MPVRKGKKKPPAVLKRGGVVATPRKVKRFDCTPDHPDQRDLSFAGPPHVMAKMGGHIDLREHCPIVYDQGELGSCTANAIAGALEFDMLKQRMADTFRPSRLFIYFNE